MPSVIWAKPPAKGSQQATVDVVDPVAGVPFDLDVTAWAVTRNRKGLMIESTTAAPGHFVNGSAAGDLKPVLEVSYVVPPDQPGGLTPDGGAVSVPEPILKYAGDPDMTHHQIQFSNDGITVSYSSGFLEATEPRYDPALDPGANPALGDNGAGIYWRVQTRGPNGDSPVSDWAFYSYKSLITLAFTAPVANPMDGSPPAQWTVAGRNQVSWQMQLKSGNQLIDEIKWQVDAAARDWTPDKGVKVPGGVGRYILEVKDDVVPRVEAENAPTIQRITKDFVTTLSGSATAINTIDATLDDPIPVITGTRTAGIPDEVALVRDGKIVPIWGPDGEYYKNWAPGPEFFSGNNFTIRDYTADLRHEHTWRVRTRTGFVDTGISAQGPAATKKFMTRGSWLVNPRTGDQVEIVGYGENPAIDQEVGEQSVVHVPINGGLLVEPKRRRLVRTTKMGSITGMVLNEHGELMEEWATGDSAEKFRLIFGRVNWSVILGDYVPWEISAYADACGPDKVSVQLNWWQRLKDD